MYKFKDLFLLRGTHKLHTLKLNIIKYDKY